MPGADIVYYETSKPTDITDAHALAYSAPVIDDCNDWTFVSGGVEAGKLFFEATRPLSTGDGQDWELLDDSATRNGHQIIAAWGDTEAIGYHGPTKRKADAVHFFKEPSDPLDAVKAIEGIQFADILHDDFDIPDDVITTYEYWCIDMAEKMGLSGDTAVHILVRIRN